LEIKKEFLYLHPAIDAAKFLKNDCPDGGIGRRARLKILFSKGSAGSIPVLGTYHRRLVSENLRAFFVFVRLSNFHCFPGSKTTSVDKQNDKQKIFII
jgi:hypothetical protein